MKYTKRTECRAAIWPSYLYLHGTKEKPHATDHSTHARPDRQTKKPGRPKGAKNKEEKRKYNHQTMKIAIELDIKFQQVKANGTEQQNKELPYGGSRRKCVKY